MAFPVLQRMTGVNIGFGSCHYRVRTSFNADDEAAKYSRVSTGPLELHTDVEITPEHPEAAFNLYSPPRAGFIQIHLTNRATGRAIREMMTVWVSPMDKPGGPGSFTISCYSDHVILIPPDQNLLLHVKADGFREWNESVGTGKPSMCPVDAG